MLPVWLRAGLVTMMSVLPLVPGRAQELLVNGLSNADQPSVSLKTGDSVDLKVTMSEAPDSDVGISIVRTLVDSGSLVHIDPDVVENDNGDPQPSFDLTFDTWNTGEVVRLTVPETAYTRGDPEEMDIDLIPSGGPFSADISSPSNADTLIVRVTVTDDRLPDIVLSAPDLTVAPGDTKTFEVGLMVPPLENTSVFVDLSAGSSSLVTFEPARVEFSHNVWSPVEIAVTANADLQGTVSISASIDDASTTDADYRDNVDDTAISVTVTDEAPPPDRPPEDPGGAASSIDTSLGVGSAIIGAVSAATQGALRPTRHGFGTPPRDDPEQDLDPNPGMLTVMSARASDNSLSLVDWFAMGLIQESVDAELVGDGTVAYAMIGSELTRTQTTVSGLLYGLEASSWDYEDETDVDKTGLFGGYYAGRTWDRLLLSGAVVLTVANNAYIADDGASADATSWRLMLVGSLSDERRLETGAVIAPYTSFLYANETLEAFSFSDGTTSNQDSASVGEISAGVEYLTAPDPHLGQFLIRGSLDKVFGTDAVTLTTGETYVPSEDISGSVTFGWLPHLGTDSAMSVELTIGQLGNDEKTEVRMDGTWDRQF